MEEILLPNKNVAYAFAPCEDCNKMIYNIPYDTTPYHYDDTGIFYKVLGGANCQDCGCKSARIHYFCSRRRGSENFMITANELETIGFEHVNKYIWRIFNNHSGGSVSVSFDLAQSTQNVRVETSDCDDMLLYNTIFFTIHDIKELAQFCLSLLRGNKYITRVDMKSYVFAKYLILIHNFIVYSSDDGKRFIWCNQERNSFSWCINNNEISIVPTSDLHTCFMFKTQEEAEQDLLLCSKLMEKS